MCIVHVHLCSERMCMLADMCVSTCVYPQWMLVYSIFRFASLKSLCLCDVIGV